MDVAVAFQLHLLCICRNTVFRFVLYTTLVTYGTALVIHRIDQTDEAHKKMRAKKEGVLILALLFVFGLLGVLKYTNFYCTEY